MRIQFTTKILSSGPFAMTNPHIFFSACSFFLNLADKPKKQSQDDSITTSFGRGFEMILNDEEKDKDKDKSEEIEADRRYAGFKFHIHWRISRPFSWESI